MFLNQFSSFFTLLKQLAIVFLAFQASRLTFFVTNYNLFSDSFELSVLWYGLRFDMVAISYLMSPFILLSILPLKDSVTLKTISKCLFHIGNFIGLLFNLIDAGYYRNSLKRTTADFFDFITTGNDFLNLLPSYLADYWYLFLLLALFTYLSNLAFVKIGSTNTTSSQKSILPKVVTPILIIGLTIIGFRGGTQLKPLDIINATSYSQPQNSALILNTPFTIIKTIRNKKIERITYYDNDKLASIYSPIQTINGSGSLKGKNVVFIILESFAKEYVGFYNNRKGYTPFLDSLSKKSLVFSDAYANGTRSIEALPSIFAGIPSLSSTPYIISNYANNSIDALPSILADHKYNSSFYHGGANGTMGFNGFAGQAGFQHYFGMDEYPNKEKDYDGKWGIFDLPYLSYFADELDNKPEPFFSTIFTLSSHHPYTVPKEFENTFPKGTMPAHETIGYTDFALRSFFEKIKSKSWFNNSVFIITADHSAPSETAKYKSLVGRYAIPFMIYDPTQELTGSYDGLFQQTDITPTLLNLLGINQQIVSFGKSYDESNRFIVTSYENSFQLLLNNRLLLFDGINATAFYNLNKDPLQKNNLLNKEAVKETLQKHTELIKAIIQQYNNRLLDNELSIQNK